jgi:hypothetical protein
MEADQHNHSIRAVRRTLGVSENDGTSRNLNQRFCALTDHSGENTAKPGSSNFITNPTNRDATKNVIKWVVEQLKDKENIVGIELLNEATEDSGLLAQWCECMRFAVFRFFI